MTDYFDPSVQSLEPEIRLLQKALIDYVEHRDPTNVTDDRVTTTLGTVEQVLKGREALASEDLATLLARVRLARFQALPAGQDRGDLKACLKWFARVRRTNPDRVPESVREALDASPYNEGWEEFGDPEWLSGHLLDAGIARLEELFHQSLDESGLVGNSSDSSDPGLAEEARDEVPNTVRHAVTLAAYLTTRFEQREERSDLHRAIELGRWVLGEGRATGQEIQAARANLAGALMNVAETTSDSDALDEAVDLFQSIVDERGTAADHANLAMALLARVETRARDDDLDLSLISGRLGVTLSEPGDPFLASRLSNLGAALRTAFDRYGDERLLDEAILIGREAVRRSDPNDLDVVRRMTNLAASLSTRFERHRQRGDIDESIDLGRLAVSRGPATGHAGRVGNLASCLQARGTVYGRVEDLQEALRLARATARTMPVGHSDRVDLLINAAGAAMSWFDWTGDLTAVLTSVELGRTAAAEAPDSVRNAAVHSNLSMHLLTAFEATGDHDFIHLAYQEADIGVRLGGDRIGPIALSNLSLASRNVFEETGSRHHLDIAIDAARRAVELCPDDHPDRSAFLSSLGLCLYANDQVDEAVEVTLAAFEHPASDGTASGVAHAANAARMLANQEGGIGGQRVLHLWEQVAGSATAPVPLRIEGLVTLARATADDVSRSAAYYQKAVDLLPAAAWHGIDPVSRTRRLAAWQGLARDTSAMVLQSDGPASALALLDSSLSQLWSRETPAAPEFKRLRRAHPALADRLDALRRARTVAVRDASKTAGPIGTSVEALTIAI